MLQKPLLTLLYVFVFLFQLKFKMFGQVVEVAYNNQQNFILVQSNIWPDEYYGATGAGFNDNRWLSGL